ncbi:phosphocholine-specific phospholipase C [Pseudopedobacter beijingensis]|uniref:phospholipase C n=1 Tax=Pseudopedobacter beijingensis TaxID=1207056 RepID=A0ABW4I951_9SPHI
MMDTRREFLKKASLLAGTTAAFQILPESIQRALAINAPAGSTYLDAEHVVFLMQENRSFDHCFGMLKGVRGFNDPRRIIQPGGLPVWIQSNKKGEHYAPFHLDIENTKATWMGSLPHTWKDMVLARNEGKMNTWLEAKKPKKEYQHMPLTMGYYDRRDLPFYYAFADAFTVCDQHFCSSLTGTSANRSYFWSGAIRENPHHPESIAHVDNWQINYKDLSWKTFPERLQKAGIDWRVYQNELSVPVGLTSEEDDWLANFTDNNLEFYKQYNVRFHPAHRKYIRKRIGEIEVKLKTMTQEDEQRGKLENELLRLRKEDEKYPEENFNTLSEFDKEIHKRAFTTNIGDPDYHTLEDMPYTEGGKDQIIKVPKGDIFYQFRKDVQAGQLPTVSWLVAPCRFSDHPGSPWYGAWYVSETLDILTANPEVWKKTIFILTYDENDGYFDHVLPFVPAHSSRPDTGKLPEGMDTAAEYVTAEQEKIRTNNPEATLDSPIGLGFRVPMVVASPWTKGGWVNSEVFDHTSSLQFLEHFLEKKTGKKIVEENISPWRRLVCGNLTSIFRPVENNTKPQLDFVNRNEDIKRIYSAKSKGLPGNYQLIKNAIPGNDFKEWIPHQEKGIKEACALPYDLNVNAVLDKDKGELLIRFEIGGNLPKTKVIGVPFMVQARSVYGNDVQAGRTWNFTVKQGEPLVYTWAIHQFQGNYDLEVYGPNGFYRSFVGDKNVGIHIQVDTGDGKRGFVLDKISKDVTLLIEDKSYGYEMRVFNTGKAEKQVWELKKSGGWYDFEIRSKDNPGFVYRYAGHIETGGPSITDPLMGGEQLPVRK